jgi:hypothetical protein
MERGANFEQVELAALPVKCPVGTFLNSLKYIPSKTDSTKARYEFKCCGYTARK